MKILILAAALSAMDAPILEFHGWMEKENVCQAYRDNKLGWDAQIVLWYSYLCKSAWPTKGGPETSVYDERILSHFRWLHKSGVCFNPNGKLLSERAYEYVWDTQVCPAAEALHDLDNGIEPMDD